MLRLIHLTSFSLRAEIIARSLRSNTIKSFKSESLNEAQSSVSNLLANTAVNESLNEIFNLPANTEAIVSPNVAQPSIANLSATTKAMSNTQYANYLSATAKKMSAMNQGIQQH